MAPFFQVDLEARIKLTVFVNAEDPNEAREKAVDMSESPGLSRLDWDEEEVWAQRVRTESGDLVVWEAPAEANPGDSERR